jgi:hypothetical protein
MIILNTFQKVVGYTWGFDYFWCIIGILFFIVGVVSIIFAIKNKDSSLWICIGGSIISIIFAINGLSQASPIYETRYQILSTDPAITTEEFVERYEIVGQDGLILTIREKK